MGREIPESVVGTHKLNKLEDVAVGSSSDGCCTKVVGLPSLDLLYFCFRCGLPFSSFKTGTGDPALS